MTELWVEDLTVQVGQRRLIQNISFTLKAKELVVLLGPNGAGKTSLIRAALGLVKIKAGTAKIAGKDTRELNPIERARNVAYLPQIRPLAWPNLVRDVVALGRYSHGAALGRLKGIDLEAVEDAIAACSLKALAYRRTDTLSGGELARVHCARAFAARAPLMVADEPTSNLDPRHQFLILDLIRTFVENGGGALVVLHDIALAARYASRLIWMKDGKIYSDGTPANTLTKEHLEMIYGVRAQVKAGKVEMDGAL